MRSFEELIKAAQDKGPKKVVVAAAHDGEVIQALKSAQELGLVEGILVGDSSLIYQEAQKWGLELKEKQVIHETDPEVIASRAVELVRLGEGDMLMKGLIDTAKLMKAVLDKDRGLRTGRALSHVAVLQVEGIDRFIFITDSGINIAPDLARKAEIIQNAIEVAQALGVKEPKVAVLTAIEVVNPEMPATVEAANLAKMAERGQIKGAIVDGPLALDLAISPEAAKHKKVNSPVAGKADILVVPYIEVGNVLLKALIHFARAKAAGVVMGAKAPIVLMSRSDAHETKTYSLALGLMVA
ncbi:phosphate butyryltransferase [Thermanaeromonas toyohensis ToBE]|uniref:Phosphate butyryltransferase n=1 Tax=Thermanaeromonas toyohensis ToBE TaxID=698762 RepID=A0A1W1V5R0_9FIRM|nr:phosphate butyryltransferase [Thermanaeromonas toyohensis]SMB88688.1 phosphate butyryltransferase [Thermanaeromonas toyohensis ToBE]